MLRNPPEKARTTGMLHAAALGVCLLCACNVAPRYVAPSVPVPPAFKEADGWQPAQPQDAALKGKWWEMYGEPELNDLEARLNIDNQNIARYFQNFMAARAQVNQAHAGLFPTVALDPSATRTGSIPAGGSTRTTVNEFALPIDVSWEPDLWGRIRNTVREYQFAAQVSAADLENERLTEQADLAEYFFQLRGQDALQDLYDRTIDADRKSLDLARSLNETGIGSEEAVAQAAVVLADAQAAGIGVALNRALYEHAIATLIGTPASGFALPVKGLATQVPAIPVGIPSQLLQRRPDIASAERAMAQANAVIGVARAAYFPSLTLAGSAGFQSSTLPHLLSAPAFFWSLGASASQAVFDAGLRRAAVAQYTASYHAGVASYRQTVLTAFQQVEDSVSTLRILARQIVQQEAATQAAQHYLDIATSRYQLGLDSYLAVLTAQTTLLSDQQIQVNLRVNQMTASVQLIQALGGGWDVARLPGPAPR
ncbi:MAG: efflux transporter outer membrane subunit [Holophaga sp.]|nr:efflux transporter outer membrane subunit [Holophaga sp.]